MGGFLLKTKKIFGGNELPKLMENQSHFETLTGKNGLPTMASFHTELCGMSDKKGYLKVKVKVKVSWRVT